MRMLRLFDVDDHEVITEVALDEDGQPADGNFGVMIHEGVAYVASPDDGTISLYDLDNLGGSPPDVLASAHELPDGLAWSPLRVGVMNRD